MDRPFRANFVSREHRYALETDTRDGQRYFTLPVSNQLVDYLEYYRLDEAEFSALMADPAAALVFARRCSAHEMDDRLLFQPGRDRGVW